MISLAPTRIPMLTAAITAATQGISAPVNVEGRDELVFYFKSSGTTSSGTFKIEEADYDPNGPVESGGWSQIGADVLASAFTGGAQQAIHISPNAYSFVRVRQTVNVGGGGSVSVVLKMQ